MKKITQEDEIKLLEYLDGKLGTAEGEQLLILMDRNPALKSRFQQLRSLDTHFSDVSREHPSKNFVQQVMSRLDQYPRPAGASIWRSVILLAGVFVTVSIASLLVSAGVFDGATQLDLNAMVFQNQTIRESLPSIRFNGKIVVNAIIVLNLIIGFFVLDRTVFRPWFQRRSGFHF